MGKQAQSQSGNRQVKEPQPKRIEVPDPPPNPSKAETAIDKPLDDGRTIQGGEPEPVRPERDVEGRDHGTEDAFDADNRGQR